MSKKMLTLAALCAGVISSSATVTVQGWWHLDSTQPIADSSGNNRTFGSAYSTAPATGGQFAGLLTDNGAGGPLGTSGYTSVQCVQVGVGVGGKRQSAMWGIQYNPPATNYGIEIWVMPQDNGIAGGSGGWIFSSGEGGGAVAFRIYAPSGAPSYIQAMVLSTGTPIGNQVLIDTNRWMHLALVNDNGTATFYTNGVACGASVTGVVSAPTGDVYIGTPGDNQAYYGYLDEARMFTFAAGAFSLNDLLLRPPGPNIVGQPQSATVYEGGAAPFSVTVSFDNTTTYQWRRGGSDLSGATTAQYTLGTVAAGDNGATFDCKVTAAGITRTSTVATLTVVPVNPSNVNAYRSAVTSEPSLVAFFPVDGDTGATVTNTKDNTHNGTLELGAGYDGRTNRVVGSRALAFNGDGDVQIPWNAAFEFPSGNGTVEAIVYQSKVTVENPTIFADGYDATAPYYMFGTDKNGLNLTYANDNSQSLSWGVAPSVVGRRVHVAWVISNATNITAYVDGQSLGTKSHGGAGLSLGGPAWIGAVGNMGNSNRWFGTIDELAIYSSALPTATIQTHFGKYFYGTNTVAPTITGQSSSKTLLAGGSPVLRVTASGTPPLTYQWKSNNVVIPGATSPTLTLQNSTAAFSANYSATVVNPYGSVDSTPIALTFVAPPSGYISRAMADNPTAMYRLNETAGPVTVDSAGFNDGTYAGSGVTYGAAGIPNDSSTAVALDGSSGRAVVPLTPVLNPNGPFTIELWCKPNPYTPFSNWSVPMSSMDRPGRTGGYEFYMGGNYNGFEFHTAAGGGYNMLTGDDRTAGNGQWWHVVGVHSNSFIYLYVNGALASPDPIDDNVTEGTAPYAANVIKDFFIGSRSDNVRFFNGAIANVAFYNYALTPSQINNHYSFAWTAAVITQQPASVTTNEWATIVLTAAASGVPNTYKWQRNGVDLTDASNLDGTAHFQNGVTNATLIITQAKPADSGQYRLVVSNPIGGTTSQPATVTVTADTTAPGVSLVQGLPTPNNNGPTPFLVKVIFNERVDLTTATAPTSYTFNPSVAVNTVTLSSDSTVAYLQTAGLTPATKYTITLAGIKDQAQTPNTMGNVGVTFTTPQLAPGLAWDFYPGINNGVANLLASPNYPYAPWTNMNTLTFNSGEITGGALENKAAFGSLGNNYGSSLSGWITPTVTTNYYFYIASDDASQLYLSADANPINAVQIAEETGCCHGFQEPGAPTVSAAIPLTAGQKYFIRALHTEGGGGDYVRVAWKTEGDPTFGTNLTAIASTYLTAYTPVPAAKLTAAAVSGGNIQISWTGAGTLLESTDLKTWGPVLGNPTSPYTVSASSAVRKFYRVQQ